MYSKMEMKIYLWWFEIAIMQKACRVFSLKKTMKNSMPDFVFENVCDKNIFVSYNIIVPCWS
jgi:hypothetical protein